MSQRSLSAGWGDALEAVAVLVWCAVAMIVIILLGGAATAMVWDPRGRRRSAVATPNPVAGATEAAVPSPGDWPRTR
ncbi:hypothetical protein [Nocardia asiatica]|uniref:hypothetical protein n=2 Tax=Nocardia asiatica TaxID=209252 RepID=UPI002458564B|nr:hypothetical protein [Nocardia asiatica]